MIQAQLGQGFAFRRTEVVGPKVSGELLTAGILAAVAAVFMIAIYVWFRFEWQYAVGAFVATGHDVFVTAGIYLNATGLHADLGGGPAHAGGLFG